MFWRRRLAAIAVLVAIGIAVWVVFRATGPAGFSDTHGADVTDVQISSPALGRKMPATVVVPADVREDAPLLVYLHGYGGDEHSSLTSEMFSALADQGPAAPIVVFPYGRKGSYWHNRSYGDFGDYVAEDVVGEMLRRYDVDPDRIAIGGTSMGGFGAFDVARLHPGLFCAVGGHEPALWRTAAETAPGAFDDAEDFAAHDVVNSVVVDPDEFDGVALWLDAGDQDAFQPGDRAFVDALQSVGADLTFHLTWPGTHGGDYTTQHWDEYMRFYADELARCD